MRIGQVEVPLDAPQARIEIADHAAVADDGRVILKHRAAQAGDLITKILANGGDLIAEFLAHDQEI